MKLASSLRKYIKFVIILVTRIEQNNNKKIIIFHIKIQILKFFKLNTYLITESFK